MIHNTSKGKQVNITTRTNLVNIEFTIRICCWTSVMFLLKKVLVKIHFFYFASILTKPQTSIPQHRPNKFDQSLKHLLWRFFYSAAENQTRPSMLACPSWNYPLDMKEKITSILYKIVFSLFLLCNAAHKKNMPKVIRERYIS